MIKLGDYCIEEYASDNRLIILLPQTPETATNTITPVNLTRKKELKPGELSALLSMIKFVYEGGRK